MRLFLKNVSTNLRKGGLFFGILPDSSELWYISTSCFLSHYQPLVILLHSIIDATQKSAQKAGLKGALWNVKFAKEEFTLFGTQYVINLTDGTASTEHLIHFPSFIKYA